MKKQIKLILGVLAVTLVGASGFATSSSSIQEKRGAILTTFRANLAKLINAKQKQAPFVNCVQKNAKPIKNIINCRAYDNERIIDKTFSALNVTLSGNEIIIGRNAPDAPEGQGFEAVFYSAEQFNGVLRDLRSSIIALDQKIDGEIRSIRFKILALSRISSNEDFRHAVRLLVSNERKIIDNLENELQKVSTIAQEQKDNSTPKAISIIGFASIGGLTAGPLGVAGGILFGNAMSDATLIPLDLAEKVLAESIQNEIKLRRRNLTALRELVRNLGLQELTEWEYIDSSRPGI